MYALFKNGKQIKKARATIGAALDDALAEGGASVGRADFAGQHVMNATVAMNEGFEIKEVP